MTKLSETDDIEAFLNTFERALEAHGVERDKRAAILAPQLTGKARLAYAAMNDADARDYDRVKTAIFQCYDTNEETYRRRFRGVQPKENETPVELVIRVRDLAEKWLKDCANQQAVVDALVKEQFVEALPEDVKVWVKERKPGTSEAAGRLAEDYRQARKADLWTTTPKKGGQKSCYSCGQVGHLAKDCLRKKGIAPATSRGEDTSKTIQVRQRKDIRRRNLLYVIIVRARDTLHVSARVVPCFAREGRSLSVFQTVILSGVKEWLKVSLLMTLFWIQVAQELW